MLDVGGPWSGDGRYRMWWQWHGNIIVECLGLVMDARKCQDTEMTFDIFFQDAHAHSLLSLTYVRTLIASSSVMLQCIIIIRQSSEAYTMLGTL